MDIKANGFSKIYGGRLFFRHMNWHIELYNNRIKEIRERSK
jgi:hypothetical protein